KFRINTFPHCGWTLTRVSFANLCIDMREFHHHLPQFRHFHRHLSHLLFSLSNLLRGLPLAMDKPRNQSRNDQEQTSNGDSPLLCAATETCKIVAKLKNAGF